MDDPALMRAALLAHAPEEGRITVHLAPSRYPSRMLFQQILTQLGKNPFWRSRTEAADTLKGQAFIWIAALEIRHVIFCRAHNSRWDRVWEALLALRQSANLRLTVLWHQPWSGTSHLARVPHRVIRARSAARAALLNTPRPPCPTEIGISLKVTAASRPFPEPVFSDALPGHAALNGRMDEPFCPGADTIQYSPSHPNGLRMQPNPEVIAVLLQIADPAIAAIFTAATVTGLGLRALSETRTCDISVAGDFLKTHGGVGYDFHGQCALHVMPRWAQPALRAGRLECLTYYQHPFGYAKKYEKMLQNAARDIGLPLQTA
ncbi:hypothetical protein ACFWCA_43170 [Streptomyces phaeochromogenes]|uniref:hypothetical protein n=1 Tax=Streptomyces phaeochromogenes TaxID=1923 RepID=UPI00369B54A4